MSELRNLVSPAEGRRRADAARPAFVAAAAEAGTVDVATARIESPIGELFLAVTPRGLLHVGFAEEDHDATLVRIAREVSPRVLGVAALTDEVRRELDEYFERTRTRFSLRLDRRLMSDFAREVLRATERVRFGEVATYREIATRIARPTAARAVGAALGSNPIPIVVPCHRIVGASGRLTGYAGGLERKAFLLDLEGHVQPTMFA